MEARTLVAPTDMSVPFRMDRPPQTGDGCVATPDVLNQHGKEWTLVHWVVGGVALFN
jgi:hypothetical protein